MKLGNFFDATRQNPPLPINPLPIDITLTCDKDVLPSGEKNPGGRPIAATGRAALVRMNPRQVVLSRVRGRELLAAVVAEALGDAARPPRTDANDENIATIYEQLACIVHEWDDATQVLGPPLFPSGEIAFELVSFEEANRILREYNQYAESAHPKEVGAVERNKSTGRSVRLAAGPPR